MLSRALPDLMRSPSAELAVVTAAAAAAIVAAVSAAKAAVNSDCGLTDLTSTSSPTSSPTCKRGLLVAEDEAAPLQPSKKRKETVDRGPKGVGRGRGTAKVLGGRGRGKAAPAPSTAEVAAHAFMAAGLTAAMDAAQGARAKAAESSAAAEEQSSSAGGECSSCPSSS